jgi:site-specific DNA recombinase
VTLDISRQSPTLALGRVSALRKDLSQRHLRSKQRVLTSGKVIGGFSFRTGHLYYLLHNRTYLGEVVHKGVSYPGEHERIVDDELWNAVHAKLAANRETRRSSRVETGSLLVGLIFDDHGNLMTPTYTTRRGNRYRYYVSRALVRGGKEDAGPHRRLGADNIERLVVEALGQQLNRVDLLSGLGLGHWSAEIRKLVRDSVERIVVGHSEVQIIHKITTTAGSPVELLEDIESPKIYTMPFPAPQARTRKEMIIPGRRESAPRRINHALVLAIARAKTWMQDLRSGKYENTIEIAQQFKLNNAHVRRVIRFGYLAPDIVEAIVEGRQPRSLTVKQLLKGIPCAWPEQRAAFGFTN